MNQFHVKCFGDLFISGVKKRVSLDFKMAVFESKIVLSGEKDIKMTDFNIDTPRALLGTITTGDNVKIKFTSTFE